MVTKHQLKTFLNVGGTNMDPLTCDKESLSIMTGLSERQITDIRENVKEYAGGYLEQVSKQIAAAEDAENPDTASLLEDKKLLEIYSK